MIVFEDTISLAARIKADYDMIANRKFCTYGAVKKGEVTK